MFFRWGDGYSARTTQGLDGTTLTVPPLHPQNHQTIGPVGSFELPAPFLAVVCLFDHLQFRARVSAAEAAATRKEKIDCTFVCASLVVCAIITFSSVAFSFDTFYFSNVDRHWCVVVLVLPKLVVCSLGACPLSQERGMEGFMTCKGTMFRRLR